MNYIGISLNCTGSSSIKCNFW